MLDRFLLDNNEFSAFSSTHFWVVIFCIFTSVLFIWFSKKMLNEKWQIQLIYYFSLFVMIQQIIKPFLKYYLGTFDITEDLPLHLCNLLAIITPFVMYKKNRTAWAIIFFWIMAGTLQSLFTPTLHQGFPHIEYFRYWFVHAGLVMTMIYAIVIFGFRLSYKDALRSMLGLNIMAAIMYPINLYLGSNYMFLNAKPDGDTIMNFLGPWPYYILSLELVMLILFSLLTVPFLVSKKIVNN